METSLAEGILEWASEAEKDLDADRKHRAAQARKDEINQKRQQQRDALKAEEDRAAREQRAKDEEKYKAGLAQRARDKAAVEEARRLQQKQQMGEVRRQREAERTAAADEIQRQQEKLKQEVRATVAEGAELFALLCFVCESLLVNCVTFNVN